MSIIESEPRGFETPVNNYLNLSSGEIMDLMQSVAPPDQTELDSWTAIKLNELTSRLIQLEGERAVAEYDRYTGVQDRDLQIDRDGLGEQLSGKTILVTGGTGLIGSTLMMELTQFHPAKLVSISRGETRPYAIVPGAEYLNADIRDQERVNELVSGIKPDIIYHLAADKYNHEAEKRVHHTLTTNIMGTQNIVEAAEAAGVQQIVYASTGKATRPYSPDIYASSKKTGEWLMTKAAGRNKTICSAVRFTHVVNDSNLRRKVNENIDAGLPVALQGTDVWLYIQSARESAQLLLNAGLEASPDMLKVQAIRNLGMPVNLVLFGLGAIIKRRADNTPLYFHGVKEGYEDKAWPHLYGLESGDFSPLINALETESAAPSDTCPQIDSFNLEIGENISLEHKLDSLESACEKGELPEVLKSLNQSLSWDMLDARLEKVSIPTLQRIEKRIIKQKEQGAPEHQRTNEYLLSALRQREQPVN